MVTTARPPSKMMQAALKLWERQTLEIGALIHYLTLSHNCLFSKHVMSRGGSAPRAFYCAPLFFFESVSSGIELILDNDILTGNVNGKDKVESRGRRDGRVGSSSLWGFTG